MKKLSILLITMLIVSALPVMLFAQQNQTNVGFHDFPWGTSVEAFKAKMGNPVHTDEVNGLHSLIYENVKVSGFSAYMLAFFSRNGLEGGTYYFDTNNIDELRQCYINLQTELVSTYGETLLYDEMSGPRGQRERRTYETSWNLPSGYIYLKVNTRTNDPVTLWYSSPALTKRLNGS